MERTCAPPAFTGNRLYSRLVGGRGFLRFRGRRRGLHPHRGARVVLLAPPRHEPPRSGKSARPPRRASRVRRAHRLFRRACAPSPCDAGAPSAAPHSLQEHERNGPPLPSRGAKQRRVAQTTHISRRGTRPHPGRRGSHDRRRPAYAGLAARKNPRSRRQTAHPARALKAPRALQEPRRVRLPGIPAAKRRPRRRL